MSTSVSDISFIGCGSVGRPLGRVLISAGIAIRGVCCRSPASSAAACRHLGSGVPMDAAGAAAAAGTILIATPDRAITDADRAAAPGLGTGQVVLHLSGALSSSILSLSRKAGAAVGSMHPLQSFADPQKAEGLVADSVFACEGDDDAVGQAVEIARRIGARPVPIPMASKPLYHAAAVSASNFLITILSLSVDLMEQTGMDRVTALDALMPLIGGTLQNARADGVPRALTGPVDRGDANTIAAHLEAIRRKCPDLEEKYVALTRMTIESALRKGSITEETAAGLSKRLSP
jgi:predicted short-subunit dehydrogenase-like oxidoreductase (DUF2520 family)